MYRRICGGQLPLLLYAVRKIMGQNSLRNARISQLVQVRSHAFRQQCIRKRLYSTDESCKAKTQLEYLSQLNPFEEPRLVRNTGIICTIGPTFNGTENLEKLIDEGLCIARLNFTHGTHEKHQWTIGNIREASKLRGKPIAIALDTKGREIRIGDIKEGKIEVQNGSMLMLSTEKKYEHCGDSSIIYVDYKKIVDTCSVGDLIYIDDGYIQLKVTGKGSTYLITEVQNCGKIGSRKGVNLCGKKLDLPALQKRDIEDLKFGVEQGIDMVFASFIQDKEDVEEIRKAMGETEHRIPVISKIENEAGLRNYKEILNASDGIMVARGDLGIEISPEKVFTVQKMMISCCNIAGKPVIVATQMLDSMTKKPRPTRAEVTDVANAVLDGADCVMLSGETAEGKHPVKAVTMMNKVCLEAESTLLYRRKFDELCKLTPKTTTTNETTAIAAVNASYLQNAAAIITVTASGKTASILSKYFPRCPIIAVTSNNFTAKICQLYRNVYPLLYEQQGQLKMQLKSSDKQEWQLNVDRMLQMAIEEGKKEGFISQGSSVVLLSGWWPDPDHINTIRIITVE